MKNYSAQEIRDIAADTGDEEIIARFETYINGIFSSKSVVKPTGKFKPFLAIKSSLDKIKNFPVIAGPKYDGVRGILHPEFGLISRQSKRIPNLHIQTTLESLNINYLDGEIITFTNGKQDNFHITQSKVMSEGGSPDFKFIVFDDFEFPQLPYIERLARAIRKMAGVTFVSLCEYRTIYTAKELALYEEECYNKSEGLIVRKLTAPYKFGKATLREGGLIKIKRFLDDEGVIVEVNKIANGLNSLGSFTVMWKKKLFNLGNGWADEMAVDMWCNRHELIGKKVTFKYQELGANGAPRFSSFIGIRRDI